MINLAGRNIEALGDDQKVVDQRIHMLSHIVAVGQHDFRRVGFYRARLQAFESLADDLVRLVHLAHADHEPRPDIAVRLGRNIEIVRLVTRVRIMRAEGRDRRRCREGTGPSGPNRSHLRAK